MTWKGNLCRGREIEREWEEAWEQITWNTRDAGTRLSNIACTHTQRRLSPSSPPASSYPPTYRHTHVWVIKNAWPTPRSKEKCCSIFFFFWGMWKIVQVLEIDVLRRGRWAEGTDGVGTAHVLALIESVFFWGEGIFALIANFRLVFYDRKSPLRAV